ncbi:hypothetical protein A2335_01755 [Candidatus Peregrinibacteria bacterium RIFOXYB2_FULL_32_7]|nr:MAG: hypothetical protein A2335_01755 [Candidatus Peregrinibacteria bacterium RIFOXYB2_FULL_32_7]
MKILIITNLYKNKKEPGKAEYHTQQFKALSEISDIQIVSPIPYLKFLTKEVPLEDEVDGIKVYYPRYFVMPKIMRSLYWLFFYMGVIGCVKRIKKDFDFDVVLSMWVYPDGVASLFIGKSLGIPVVIGALGSDINLNMKFSIRRKLIAYAMNKCQNVLAVSSGLKGKMIEMGVDTDKIHVIYNGVDKELFQPLDKVQCRKELGLPLDKKIILHIGNHVHVKGVDILIEAVAGLSGEYCVVMVGDGNLTSQLKEKVSSGKYRVNVLFPGRISHNEIPVWINAADIFCLPSRNEGHPNVIMEALACGTPVVASKVGGIPEVINSEDLGILVEPENVEALYQGISSSFKRKWDRDVMCKRVEGFSWKDNAEKLKEILKEAVSRKL